MRGGAEEEGGGGSRLLSNEYASWKIKGRRNDFGVSIKVMEVEKRKGIRTVGGQKRRRSGWVLWVCSLNIPSAFLIGEEMKGGKSKLFWAMVMWRIR